MTLNTILIFAIMAALLSCNQNPKASNTKPDTTETNTNIALQQTQIPTTGTATASPQIRNIRSMLHDKNGTFWFGSDGEGVFRYDGRTVVQFTVKDGLCHNQIRSIREDKSDNIWFETGNGICRYDGHAFLNQPDVAAADAFANATGAWKKEAGSLWFHAGGNEGGVFRYNGDTFFRYQFPNPEPHSSVPYDMYAVYCTFEDRDGNIWFGTQSKGVCRFDGKDFLWLRDKGLAGAAVRAIYQDKSGALWFGNNGFGLFRFDGKTLTNLTDEKGLANPDFVKNFQEKEGTLARVWTISEDAGGALWIGTIDAGAWRYDGKNLTNYTTKDGLADNGVTVIYKDKTGELWFGTAGDVCRFNGKTFTTFVVK